MNEIMRLLNVDPLLLQALREDMPGEDVSTNAVMPCACPGTVDLIAKQGKIDSRDMYNTFNMGVGMAVIVSPETADAALSALKAEGIDAYVCGEIVAGEEKVALC